MLMLSISFAVDCILAAILIALGFLTLSNNVKRTVNRAFAALTFASGLYIITNALVRQDTSQSLFWVRMTFFSGAWMTLFLVIFFNNLTGRVLILRSQIWVLVGSLIVVPTTLAPGF